MGVFRGGAKGLETTEIYLEQNLEEWIEESGVHYSDLLQQNLSVQGKTHRLLANWLSENFFRTPEGTWQPPANGVERIKNEMLCTNGMLRCIKCFTRAPLEGGRPHD